MSLTITPPYRDTAQDPIACKYFASENPIIFRLERKDFVIVDTQDDGSGNTQVNVTGTLPSLTVGGTIFINAGTFGPGGLCGNFDILSGSSGSLVIDTAFTGAQIGGYINLITDRPNYRINTRIQCIGPLALNDFGQNYYEERVEYTNNLGVAQADLSEFLKVNFVLTNLSDYDTLSIEDNNLCQLYTVEFIEVWDSSTESWSTLYYVYAMKAAMQIQHTGGACMPDFLPTEAGNNKARFLSASSRLRRWEGFPFDVHAIIPAAVSGGTNATSLVRHEVQYTGSTPGSVADDALVGITINTQFIQRVIMAGSYPDDVNRVNISINYSDFPTIYTNITEELQVRIHQCNKRNPVYVAWLNKEGGLNYWLFECRQLFGAKTTIISEFRKFFSDLELQDSTSEVITKSTAPYMIAGNDALDAYDVLLMTSLVESEHVMMLMNPSTWDVDGCRWQVIIPEASDYKLSDSKKKFNPSEIKFRLAERFIQNN